MIAQEKIISKILESKKKMPSANQKPRTLYDKVFEAHIVDERDDGTILLYIGKHVPRLDDRYPGFLKFPGADRHLVHEVTSPVSILSGGETRKTRDG